MADKIEILARKVNDLKKQESKLRKDWEEEKNINDKSYAKIMFVVGTNHDYYQNMELANKLVVEVEKLNKSISRGIFTRNSIYNQDFNNNCVLIEVGGPESTYESVVNSLKVLARAISNYLGEYNG